MQTLKIFLKIYAVKNFYIECHKNAIIHCLIILIFLFVCFNLNFNINESLFFLLFSIFYIQDTYFF